MNKKISTKEMKKTNLFAIVALAAVTTITSCESDNGNDNEPSYTITDLGNNQFQIEGTFDENFTLTADKDWVITGGVFVDNGATLTIDAGTTVWAADDATTPFLSILRGGKIMAMGTKTDPIIMTTLKPNPTSGSWGGIVINGKAPSNKGTDVPGEGGTGNYGGNEPDDNSGEMHYVVVKYAGKILGTDNELNGFSFNGVGSSTQLDHLQAYMGSDDGFEFFGGRAQLKYAVSEGNEDDSFDWTHGFQGKGQFWVVEQYAGGGDRGIEADNNSSDNGITPMSAPMLSNLTLVGIDDGDGGNQGMKLREGTAGNIHNCIVTGFPKRGVQVEHDQTVTNMQNGDLLVANSIVDNTNPWVATASDGSDVTCDFANDNTNTTETVTLVNGYVGVVTNGNEVDPSAALDAWFESVSYIGAVPASDDWTDGWTE
jgi:hypothetical protein